MNKDQQASFNAVVKFIEGGMRPEKFTQKLYQSLSNMFGHTAHFDRLGFVAAWFQTLEQRAAFVRRIEAWTVREDRVDGWAPVERELQHWMPKTILARLERQIAQEKETAERAEIARLKAKYEEVQG